ncbi:MAG: glycosidase [Pirellulaceae bacterium]|nr:MAG: glycosidase [Pirellulaceae bacterium]
MGSSGCRYMEVRRTGLILKPNSARVLVRPFEFPDTQRVVRILGRLMELTELEVAQLLPQVMAEFRGRHVRLQEIFFQRFATVEPHLLTDRPLSEARKLLIGACFTQEYALESAALFNPSIVWHPNQDGVPEGSRRFILSLRCTGEGHISSVGFRSGIVDSQGNITIDRPTGFVTPPRVIPHAQYDKALFFKKLAELGLADGFVETLSALLDDHFSMDDLERAIRFVLRQNPVHRPRWEPVSRSVLALAKANYQIQCDPDSDLSERVIFPYAPTEKNGIEDVRLVQFTEDDGSIRYYGTYTAFDGDVVFPQIFETTDFVHFKVDTLNGPEVRNKGFALFPRKINGLYAMLSRQDGENIYLMYSEMLHFWYTKQLLMRPMFPWEVVQIGNCGSPIETEAGWLVLTHGVGPMRKYAIGAALLDRDDPSRVLARLPEPLLSPNANEREGYVPNVVYTCGAVVHEGLLVIPYAMADYATTFAVIPLDDVLRAMVPVSK